MIAGCQAHSFAPAGPLTLSYKSPGLHQQVDPPRYYDVRGTTAAQVTTQLDACTPVNTGQPGTFDAETTWFFNWTYRLYKKPAGQCNIRGAAVGVHVTVLYPRWVAPAQAAPSLAGQWQTFVTALQLHENNHVQMAIQYGQQLLGGLQHFPDTHCADLQHAVDAYGDKIVQTNNRAQIEYDNQTKYGATEGAIFP